MGLALVCGEDTLEVFILAEQFLIGGFLRGELLFKRSHLNLEHVQIFPLFLATAHCALPVLLTFPRLAVLVRVLLEIVLTSPIADLLFHVFLFLFGQVLLRIVKAVLFREGDLLLGPARPLLDYDCPVFFRKFLCVAFLDQVLFFGDSGRLCDILGCLHVFHVSVFLVK